MKLKYKTLSNFDILNICKKLNIPLIRICMKDEITEYDLRHNGFFIINLQNHDQQGTHWVGFYKQNRNIYYFDSFGGYIPQNEINLFKKDHDNIYYSKAQIQDFKSVLCGFFVIGFFLFLKINSGNPYNNMIKYINMFYQNTKNNDEVIKNYLNKYYK